jgi:hypothetical protein
MMPTVSFAGSEARECDCPHKQRQDAALAVASATQTDVADNSNQFTGAKTPSLCRDDAEGVLSATRDGSSTTPGRESDSGHSALIHQAYRAGLEPEDMPMKPRSPVAALLAITETLLAAKAARSARAKQASSAAPRRAKVAKFLSEARPLVPRIKTQAVS